ncbi:MAG: peptidoglycan DD-metalloendopeptidase family protein [Acidobacteriota bacterium]|nr:peptidoglycan DD-metalloendopeptidase family protein [Acidobacteriota bacterium]MDD8028478.1 peptidoglycan DD-metalloendopeptidase family protein [Acidobacteriota bacterium]HNT31555.1 peptidoglycan DD-metalloendopeptidase family protein [Candidatus Aminicenantes bacterium]
MRRKRPRGEPDVFLPPLSGPNPLAPRRPPRKKRPAGRPLRVAAAAALVVLLIAAAVLVFRPFGPGREIVPAVDSAESLQPAEPGPTTVEEVILPGETLSEILGNEGLSPAQIDALVRQVRPVFNLARIVSGRTVKMTFAPSGELLSLDYPIDESQFLLVTRTGEGYAAEKKAYAYETRPVYVHGVIDEHLYGAVLAGGEKAGLAIELEQIFGWDVDFYAGLRTGDAFRVLVEKKYLDGRFQRYGDILAAEFWNDGRRIEACRFDYEEGGSLKSGYFHPDGRSLRKEFLKSPLQSYRITSRFSSRRLHPVRKVFRAHYGVDYAAPVGTPVFATADGRVEEAGWKGGAGRMIRLSHKNGYETIYMHLSTILVRAGQRVEGGQRIGKVGSSGESTGPHLDYRIKRFGSYLNPLSAKFMPVAPLPARWLPDFQKRAAALRVVLGAPLRITGSFR